MIADLRLDRRRASHAGIRRAAAAPALAAILGSVAMGTAAAQSPEVSTTSPTPPAITIVQLVEIAVPPGHVLAALKDEHTGALLAAQPIKPGSFACLRRTRPDESPAPLTPVFAADGPTTDFSFLLPPQARGGVKISEIDGGLRVSVCGQAFTEYRHVDVPKPFFYPLLAPGGVHMTRHFPMRADRPDEERDHPHQRSLWFAFGSVNGVDFWTESDKSGRICHTRLSDVVSGPVFGSFTAANEWRDAGGRPLLRDERVFHFYATPDQRLIDYEVTLIASEGPVTLGDTKEGMMAIRVAPWLCLTGKKPTGHIVNSAGQRDAVAWGKRAAWVDYFGAFDDASPARTLGVAIFDHPSNLRHPTWWHARDYGLFAANPFGQHDFEGKPPGTGDYRMESGETLTFRYRIVIHAADADTAAIGAMFDAWTREPALAAGR
ncbi:MAG: hypothetical protein CHACPFDD_01427 [Phycisphaerae bacterium]|nr:hypothetical protein [Phycisphaerae bacterium]